MFWPTNRFESQCFLGSSVMAASLIGWLSLITRQKNRGKAMPHSADFFWLEISQEQARRERNGKPALASP